LPKVVRACDIITELSAAANPGPTMPLRADSGYFSKHVVKACRDHYVVTSHPTAIIVDGPQLPSGSQSKEERKALLSHAQIHGGLVERRR